MARREHKDFKEVLKTTDEIELTVQGRNLGRESSRPVWFVQDGNKLYLLPVTGSDSEWYKNLLTNAEITLAADGSKLSAKAKPIRDPKRVRETVEKFRAKHGAGEVKKYYSKFDVAVEVPLD